MIPQIIVLAIGLWYFGREHARHGQDKEPEKHNAGIVLFAMLLNWALLYWGGFFDVFWK